MMNMKFKMIWGIVRGQATYGMRGHVFRYKLFLRSQFSVWGIDLWLPITFLEKKKFKYLRFLKVDHTLNNHEGVS